MSVIEENWDEKVIDLFSCVKNDDDSEIELKYSLQQSIGIKLKNSFVTQDRNKGKINVNQEDELKVLVEKNKELRTAIDQKQENISQKQLQYEEYKKDQARLSQEIKDRHEAFLMAKKYFKKFLKVYLTIESCNKDNQTIFLQFFTETKKESEDYSLRLLKNTKTGLYQLLSTTPQLQHIKDLQRKLQETNDVTGALCSIRQAFTDIKNNKI